MGLCARKITANMGYDCDIIGGVENNYYVFNREDIAAYVRNVTNPQIIEDITMVATKKGFLYQGFNTSTKPKTVLTKKTYSVRYTQTIDAVIFDRGSAVKAELEALALDEVVIVVENKAKTDDKAFEIYGLDAGLILAALTDDPTNSDTEGAYVVQWSSPADNQEPHLPATFFDTDYATTKAALLALITP